MSTGFTRLRRWSAVALLSMLVGAPHAFAQAPDAEQAIYTNACFMKSNGSTRGQALQVAKSLGTYKFVFQDFRDYPRPPELAEGQIAGDKLTLDIKVVGLPVRFTGTITPQEIRGRLSNGENDAYFNTEVRWPRLPPNTLMPDCK